MFLSDNFKTSEQQLAIRGDFEFDLGDNKLKGELQQLNLQVRQLPFQPLQMVINGNLCTIYQQLMLLSLSLLTLFRLKH